MLNKKYINKFFKLGISVCLVLMTLPNTLLALENNFTTEETALSCGLSVEVSINNLPECNQTDGSVSLIATGGTGNISYSWGDSDTRDDLTPGTYCIVVYDESGCSVLVDFTLATDNCPPVCTNFSASAVIEKQPTCGNSNGIVSLSFLGANEPVAFSWGAEVRQTNLTAGNYSVTLTDATGCIATVDFELTETPCKCEDFEATVEIERLPKCDQSDGIANIVVKGANGNVTYSWGNSSRMENLAPDNYWVTVTDEEGCSTIVDFVLGSTACDCEFSAKAIVEREPSCTRNDGAVRLEFSNAVGTVRHNLGSKDSYDNLSPGTYHILVSDSICSVIVTFTLAEPDPDFCQSICELSITPTINQQPSCNLRDGSVCLEVEGAQGAVTFSWGPKDCYDNLRPGVYTVTATDEVCTATVTFELEDPDQAICDTCKLSAVAVINQLPSCDDDDGSVSLEVSGATGSVTYDWGPLPRYDNLRAGVYSVLITDNICTYRVNFIIAPPLGCPPKCTLSAAAFVKKQPSCAQSDGMACIQVSGAQGPVTYDWGPENCQNNLAPGFYIVLVSDTVCSETVFFTLAASEEDCPCPLKGKLAISKLPDCENEFGSACIDVSGATGKVTYSWGPDRCRTDLAPGTYAVTISDESSPPCRSTINFTIKDKPLVCCTLKAEIDSLVPPNCDTQDGFVSIKVSGAKDALTYEWSDIPNSVSTRSNLDTGNYQVIVIEANTGCRDTIKFRFDKPTLSFTTKSSTRCDTKGFIRILVDGGNENHTFVWSDGVSGPDRDSLMDGEYTVTITNQLTECTTSQSFGVYTIGPDVDLQRDKNVCAGDTTTLTLLNRDTSQMLTYQWITADDLTIFNSASNKPSFVSEKSGTPFTVKVIVENMEGCMVEDSVTVQFRVVPDTLDPNFVFAANCESTAVTFKNGNVDADLFTWDFGVVDVEDDTSTATKTTYLYPAAGTYMVTLKLSEDLECSRDLSELRLTRAIEVGTPINLMANFDYDPNLPCEEEVALTFTNSSTAAVGMIDSLVWFYSDNTVVNQESISTTIERADPINVTLTIYDSTKLCEQDTTKTILLDPIEIESVEVPACINDSISLIEFIPNPPSQFVWAENDFFAEDALNPIVALEEEEDFDLFSTVENECLTYELTVLLSEKPKYEESRDTSLCAESEKISIGVVTQEDYDLTWATDVELMDTLTVQNPFEAGVGSYYFQLINENCSIIDSIIIAPKMLDISSFGDTICEPGTATVGIINNNPLDLLTYEGLPVGNDPSNIPVEVSESQQFEVLVKNQFGCQSATTINVMVSDTSFADGFFIQVNPDELAAGETGVLNTPTSTKYQIIWNPHPTLDTTRNPVEISPTECTTYSARIVENLTGCEVTRDTVINPGCISGNIFFPNAFSPNGDNKNDMLRVRGVTGLEEMKLIIFNRWGQKIFESTDPNIGWNGTFKGERVTSDVYGYHISVKCPSRPPEILQGNFTVLR